MPATRLKSALAASVLLCATSALTSFAVESSAAAGVVPNMYHCSTQTNQCWQTNPPHVASIINKCYWYNDRVVNAAYAPDTCDKYTAR